MVYQFAVIAALIAVANGGVISAPGAYAAPLAYAAAPVAPVGEEYDSNPQYSYGYNVQDNLTGDSKTVSETRNGDVVQGSYSLVEPDGNIRTVEYTADPIHGFNAVVSRQPLAAKAVAAAPVGIGYTPVAKAYLH